MVSAQDMLNSVIKDEDADGATLSQVFPVVMAHISFIHWLFVGGSVMLCLITANRE